MKLRCRQTPRRRSSGRESRVAWLREIPGREWAIGDSGVTSGDVCMGKCQSSAMDKDYRLGVCDTNLVLQVFCEILDGDSSSPSSSVVSIVLLAALLIVVGRTPWGGKEAEACL
jgi:hypothetical protein